jgi:flagellar assembly protein FliH
MSNVIKINPRSSKMNVKVAGIGNSFGVEEEVDLLKKQLEDHYAMGYKEAKDKTLRDLEKDFTDKLYHKYEEVFNILQSFDEKFIEYEKYFEELVIVTAYEIAKKVVQREIEEKTIIDENIKVAINKIIGANEVRLKLNPNDVDELTDYSKGLLNNSSFTKIKIEGDSKIERGGCLIETEIGNVDARISTQLMELKKQLENSLQKKS